MSGTIHPYYLSKAEDVLAEQCFDPDADPTPLAAWAQDAAGDTFAYATSDGTIVGTGAYRQGRLFAVGHADEATVARYGLTEREAGLARGHIAAILHRPVVLVKASRFAGPASHAYTGRA